MLQINLPYNFEPRLYQIPMLTARELGYKREVYILHRRAGKDLTAINDLARADFTEQILRMINGGHHIRIAIYALTQLKSRGFHRAPNLFSGLPQPPVRPALGARSPRPAVTQR